MVKICVITMKYSSTVTKHLKQSKCNERGESKGWLDFKNHG